AGVGDKTAAVLLNRFGDLHAIIAAAKDPEGDMGPGPRGKIKAALEYLAVAPKVVAVARDIDLGTPDLRLPRSPADPEMLAAIAQQWGLTSPVERLTSVLSA
ncbi:MAG: 5-3 exonuclease, partial [Marmoricola sp.]|nr:5-3 exonuclease [Marmoricola sp.]